MNTEQLRDECRWHEKRIETITEIVRDMMAIAVKQGGDPGEMVAESDAAMREHVERCKADGSIDPPAVTAAAAHLGILVTINSMAKVMLAEQTANGGAK